MPMSLLSLGRFALTFATGSDGAAREHRPRATPTIPTPHAPCDTTSAPSSLVHAPVQTGIPANRTTSSRAPLGLLQRYLETARESPRNKSLTSALSRASRNSGTSRASTTNSQNPRYSSPPSLFLRAGVLEKLLSVFSAASPSSASVSVIDTPSLASSPPPLQQQNHHHHHAPTPAPATPPPQPDSRRRSIRFATPASPARRRSHENNHTSPADPTWTLSSPDSHAGPPRPPSLIMSRSPVVVGAPRPASFILDAVHPPIHRNSFTSVRSVKSLVTSSASEITEKPVASGGGLVCSISLAEPHVFLAGFSHNHDESAVRRQQSNATSLLRGKLQLTVTKNVKIRSITLVLHGTARTEWPEGVPPAKMELSEQENLRTQALTFFHAMHGSWSTAYGNQCTYRLKSAPENGVGSPFSRFSPGLTHSDSMSSSSGLSAKDIKRLSLQQVKARSFGKDDSPMAHPDQAKGYKIFYPGTYEYSFEFPIDHHQVETISLPYGSVKWALETSIERAGAFKPNLHGSKEVSIVRVPDQLSLETVEPISISRQWEDQLYYDIVISGKSFPIGGTIPIAFKLTPLAKVRLHKLKVFVTETGEYWTSNHRVTRKDPGRKILLFEKVAGKPLDKQYADSSISFVSGGELTPEQRTEARTIAARRLEMEARHARTRPAPLPEPAENMLGDLDLGLEAYWGSTEMEMNVHIPTCRQMAEDPRFRLHPDCSWKNARVHHWIKVVMRISRPDETDPTGNGRRHFEISIDSPFTILSCLATQANTALPQYSGRDPSRGDSHGAPLCGCPDTRTMTHSPSASVEAIPVMPPTARVMPQQPRAAHLHTHATHSVDNVPTNGHSEYPDTTAHTELDPAEAPRPIHLMRVPSYAPPAFDADETPPMPDDLLLPPPPNYDVIVGTPSVDGLADYFSRLERYEHPNGGNADVTATTSGDDDDESDSDSDLHVPTRITSRGGRVNVTNPRTPGGARRGPSRSMDIQRPAIPLDLSLATITHRRAEQ